MRTKLLKAVSEYGMFRPGDRVLVAYSGGSDSTALLHMLHSLAKTLKIELFAAHVNHRIRETAAVNDEAFARDFASRFEIPFFSTEIDVPGEAKKSGESLEEAARRLRYGYLEETADSFGCTRIATAHTQDDSVESILLNLIRGCGPTGLLGIPAMRGKIVRPMIFASKEEVLRYLSENRLPFAKDATNDDVSFSRNRVRHRLLPEMRAINPSVEAAVTRLSEIVRSDVRHIEREAEDLYWAALRAEEPLTLAVPVLKNASPAISHRVLRRAAGRILGSTLSEKHTRALYSLLESSSPSSKIQLKSGYEAAKNYDMLIIGRSGKKMRTLPPALPLIPGEKTVYLGFSIYVETVKSADAQEKSVYYLRRELAEEKLEVRPRRSGDRITLKGKPGSRALSRLFIDEQVPKDERDFLPVLAANGEVFAIYPLGPSRRHMAEPGEPALRVSILRDR